jgi:hypothetical protein
MTYGFQRNCPSDDQKTPTVDHRDVGLRLNRSRSNNIPNETDVKLHYKLMLQSVNYIINVFNSCVVDAWPECFVQTG